MRGLELHVGLWTGLAGAGQAWSGIPLGTWIGPRFLVWVQAGWHLLLWSHGEVDNDRMWPPQDPHFSGAQACQPSPVHLQACFPAVESCQDGQGHFRVPQGPQPGCHQALLVFPGSKHFQRWRELWRYSRDFSQQLGKLRESKALDQGLTGPSSCYLSPPSVPKSLAQTPGLLPEPL